MTQADIAETFAAADAAPERPARVTMTGAVNGNEYTLILSLILAMGAVDWVWSRSIGLNFTGWSRPALAMAGLVFIWAVYGYLRPRPRLSEMAAYGALWIGFTAAGCVLTYLAASVPRPLIDDTLGGFDLSLGFNWPVWSDFVLNHPGLRVPLMAAYGSLMPQILGSLALFALAGISGRNKEFLLNALIALLITTFVTALWPSVGPCVQFACAGERSEEARYIADVLIVRSGAAANFDLSQMQGIVTFPSYHAVLAMLLIYAHRGLRWSLSPIVAINLFMLLSIPSEGGHYVADMFGGVGVTALTMLITGVRWKKLLPPRP